MFKIAWYCLRVGRPSSTDERRVEATVEAIFDSGRSLRFKDMARAAETQGISKPTMWRHVQALTEKGIVVHEGKTYRKNPLLKYQITMADEFPVTDETQEELITRGSVFAVEWKTGAVADAVTQHKLLADKKVPYDEFLDKFLTTKYGHKLLDFKTIWRNRTPEAEWIITDYPFSVGEYFELILLSTLNLLYAVWRTEDADIACEIARLRFERDVMSHVAELARHTWLVRRRVSMAELHNLELRYRIHHQPSEQVQRCKYYNGKHFHYRRNGKEWCTKAP